MATSSTAERHVRTMQLLKEHGHTANSMGSFGQLISPLLVAYVAEQFGWNSMFYLFVVFAIISGTLLATKWNYGKKPAPAT